MRRTKWAGNGERKIEIDGVTVVVRDLTERDRRELQAEILDLKAQGIGDAVISQRWGARVVEVGTLRVEGYERADGTPIATAADLVEHGESDVINATFDAIWLSAEADPGNG